MPPTAAPFPDVMRTYFLDSDAPLPAQLAIYAWPYAGETQVIAENCGVSRKGAGTVLVGHVLKFFPLAFWVVYESPAAVSVRLPRLVKPRSLSIDDEAALTLDWGRLPRTNWPEHPSPDE